VKEKYAEQLKGLCCVEISGESCANCLTLMPILEELCSSRNDIRLVHIEADYTTLALMEEWEVEKVPTILLMDDGEIFARCTGFQPEEILQLWLEAKIEEQKAKKA
jgi:thioredoxin 2